MCLLEQPFIKESDRAVSSWSPTWSSLSASNIMVKRFARFQLGEQAEQAA